MTWPEIHGSYALAAVALATSVYVIIAITRFMGSQLATIAKIATTLDNHLHDVADRLTEVGIILKQVEASLEKINERLDKLSTRWQ